MEIMEKKGVMWFSDPNDKNVWLGVKKNALKPCKADNECDKSERCVKHKLITSCSSSVSVCTTVYKTKVGKFDIDRFLT
jgi:hypothetical protein